MKERYRPATAALSRQREGEDDGGLARWPMFPSHGSRYDAHRAAVMRRTLGTKNPEGLTATYNRFHDPNERSADIATLRALHAEMDRAVLDAYGWTDLRPAYDYRVQLDERVRYTWDDDTRDEVLARLLEENRQRAGASEAAATVQAAADDGAAVVAARPKRGRRKKGDDAGGPWAAGGGASDEGRAITGRVSRWPREGAGGALPPGCRLILESAA